MGNKRAWLSWVIVAMILIWGVPALWVSGWVNVGNYQLNHALRHAETSALSNNEQVSLQKVADGLAEMPAGEEAALRIQAHLAMQTEQWEKAADYWQQTGVSSRALFLRGRVTPIRQESAHWYRMAAEGMRFEPADWFYVGLACLPNREIDPICERYVEENAGNHLLDPSFQFDFYGWLGETMSGTNYTLEPCSDNICTHIKVNQYIPESYAHLYQCLALPPDETYRFSAWLKVTATDQTRWRPLYLQGEIDEGSFASWVDDQVGSRDWAYWEYTFTTPTFDDGVGCVSPIILMGEGEAWFHSPQLVEVE